MFIFNEFNDSSLCLSAAEEFCDVRESKLKKELEEVRRRKRELERQYIEVTEKVWKAKMIFDRLENLRKTIHESFVSEGLSERRVSRELDKISAATCDDAGIIAEEIVNDEDKITVCCTRATEANDNESVNLTASFRLQSVEERDSPLSIFDAFATEVTADRNVINRNMEVVKETRLLKDDAKRLKLKIGNSRLDNCQNKQLPVNYEAVQLSELFLPSHCSAGICLMCCTLRMASKRNLVLDYAISNDEKGLLFFASSFYPFSHNILALCVRLSSQLVFILSRRVFR